MKCNEGPLKPLSSSSEQDEHIAVSAINNVRMMVFFITVDLLVEYHKTQGTGKNRQKYDWFIVRMKDSCCLLLALIIVLLRKYKHFVLVCKVILIQTQKNQSQSVCNSQHVSTHANAAMIGRVAVEQYKQNDFINLEDLDIKSRLKDY